MTDQLKQALQETSDLVQYLKKVLTMEVNTGDLANRKISYDLVKRKEEGIMSDEEMGE